MLKLIRNHFVDSGFFIQGKEINKSVIQDVLTCTNDKSDLSIAYKVSMDSLIVKDARRQKVKLAAKLFSHTVSQVIRRCVMSGDISSENALECADFFKLVSKSYKSNFFVSLLFFFYPGERLV